MVRGVHGREPGLEPASRRQLVGVASGRTRGLRCGASTGPEAGCEPRAETATVTSEQ